MPPRQRKFKLSVLLLTAAAAVAGIAIWQANTPGPAIPSAVKTPAQQAQGQQQQAQQDERTRMAEADAKFQSRQGEVLADAKPQTAQDAAVDPNDYGSFPRTELDANASTRLVADPAHPEYRHISQRGEPFDAKKWASDEAWRAHYLAEPVPSRCREFAQPGPDVRPLAPVGEGYITLRQGEKASIRVAATPGMPVSATSLDGARFGNLLQAQTVVADAQTGIAEFTLEPTPGVIEECRILVGSPVHSGPPVKFFLNVLPPQVAQTASH